MAANASVASGLQQGLARDHREQKPEDGAPHERDTRAGVWTISLEAHGARILVVAVGLLQIGWLVMLAFATVWLLARIPI